MSPKPPRDYQNRAHASIIQARSEGHRRILLVSPTGSGKTFMLGRVFANAVRQGKRGAWFAHRRELITQAVAALESWGLSVGHSGMGANRPVQVLSVQGALARGEVPQADLVGLDEAHHFAADLWGELPKLYDRAVILGASATPERGDGRPLDHLFEHMIVVAQPGELAGLGHLVRCETIRPGRPQPKGKIAQFPVDAYIKEGLRGKRNVVFAPNLRDAETFAAQFRAQGIGAQVISGEMPTEDRDASLAAFERGTLRVLVNVYVLTEGWDCPATEVVTLARPFATSGAFMQAGGRGLRTHPGKDQLILLDLVGATYLHGDLLEDRVYSLDGEGMKRASGGGPRFCRVCGNLIVDDGCECGTTERERALIEATNDPLVKYAYIRRDNDTERAQRLAKWIATEIAKGRTTYSVKLDRHLPNWKSALFKYKHTYGAAPTSRITSHALALAEGRSWCTACGHGRCRCEKAAAS